MPKSSASVGRESIRRSAKRSVTAAKTAPAITRTTRSRNSTLSNTKQAIRSAIDQKALDVCGLDLRDVSSVSDYFVIASGTSERHVKGIADKIKNELLEIGETPLAVNGYEHGEWIVLDYGALMIHVFFEPVRQFYNLDGLWKNAQRVPLSQELKEQARMLRTGIFG